MATEPEALAPGSVERFWAWWAAARTRLETALDRQTLSKHLAREITDAVEVMHPSFVWEISPGHSSRHALTITPEGDLSLRRLTAVWLRSAPPADETWEYHAARPPAAKHDLRVDDRVFPVTDFRVDYNYDDVHERYHVTLHHPLFDRVSVAVRRQAALLALEQLLGEDDVERWLGTVEVATKEPDDAVSMNKLRGALERRRTQATGHKFSLGHGRDERGSPALLMFNTALKQIDHLDHVFHLAVYFRLHEPRPDGLPDPAEAEQLNKVEDQLLEQLGDNALPIGRLTLAARREVHFYIRDPEAAEQSIAEWRTHADAWGVNHTVRPDPAWSFSEDGFYRPLAPRPS